MSCMTSTSETELRTCSAVRMVASSSISDLAQNLDRFLQSTRGYHSTDELVNLNMGERTIVILMSSSVEDWIQDLSTSESDGPLDITDIMLGVVQCRVKLIRDSAETCSMRPRLRSQFPRSS